MPLSSLSSSSSKTLRVQEFRASGTFNVPVGVKTVGLFMVGAGGGTGATGAMQIGQAGNIVEINYDVSGKASCAVLIGAGSPGSNGGDTSFDGVAIAKGGAASIIYNNGSAITSSTGYNQCGKNGFGGLGGMTSGTIIVGVPQNGGAGLGQTPQANSGAGATGTNPAVAGASGYCRVEWYE